MNIKNRNSVSILILTLISVSFLTSCSSGNKSSNNVSVCTTFSQTISAAEEMQGGQMELNRTLGGSDTQISPSPFEIGSLGINEALSAAGISFDEGLFNIGAVQKFLDVAGECLSDDTFQYLSNYVD